MYTESTGYCEHCPTIGRCCVCGSVHETKAEAGGEIDARSLMALRARLADETLAPIAAHWIPSHKLREIRQAIEDQERRASENPIRAWFHSFLGELRGFLFGLPSAR